MYLFGYGSLVNIKSAQKSFHRILKHEDFIPVVVQGYQKVWNAIEHVVFENETQVTDAIFLSLNKDVTQETNGVLLKIDNEEFENLKKREKNYSCIEINTSDIIGFETAETIVTFMTNDKEKIAQEGQENCYIPKKYIELLEEGLMPYSDTFSEEFIASYSQFPFEIKKGKYAFLDPIQNKYAKDGLRNEGKV